MDRLPGRETFLSALTGYPCFSSLWHPLQSKLHNLFHIWILLLLETGSSNSPKVLEKFPRVVSVFLPCHIMAMYLIVVVLWCNMIICFSLIFQDLCGFLLLCLICTLGFVHKHAPVPGAILCSVLALPVSMLQKKRIVWEGSLITASVATVRPSSTTSMVCLISSSSLPGTLRQVKNSCTTMETEAKLPLKLTRGWNTNSSSLFWVFFGFGLSVLQGVSEFLFFFLPSLPSAFLVDCLWSSELLKNCLFALQYLNTYYSFPGRLE